MGQRVVRINELLMREISHVLHTRYQSETVAITVTAVDTAPNLRRATVYFSVFGDAVKRVEAERFFARHHELIRREVGSKIVLKYLPHLEFKFDPAAERGDRLNQMLDEMGLEGEATPPESDT